MDELLECKICKSLVRRSEIDGQCPICERKTCSHCKRVCERCQNIFCPSHISRKIVMRQEEFYLHILCDNCKELW